MKTGTHDPAPAEGRPGDVEREIDELVDEHHRRTPREAADLVGAAYARFSTAKQDSVGDQVRALLEAATRMRTHVPRENVYYDRAVRGCKSRRPGLDGLREALARRGSFDVLLVFSTSRLFRKAYKAFGFVEEEVVGRGRRCVFTSTGIDTADEQFWGRS